MRVCNREWALRHGDLLIYSQTSVISRGLQRLWPLVLVYACPLVSCPCVFAALQVSRYHVTSSVADCSMVPSGRWRGEHSVCSRRMWWSHTLVVILSITRSLARNGPLLSQSSCADWRVFIFPFCIELLHPEIQWYQLGFRFLCLSIILDILKWGASWWFFTIPQTEDFWVYFSLLN